MFVYSHEYAYHHISQQHIPSALLGMYFNRPSDQGYEEQIEDRVAQWRRAQREALGITKSEELLDLTQDEIETIKLRHTRRGSGRT